MSLFLHACSAEVIRFKFGWVTGQGCSILRSCKEQVSPLAEKISKTYCKSHDLDGLKAIFHKLDHNISFYLTRADRSNLDLSYLAFLVLGGWIMNIFQNKKDPHDHHVQSTHMNGQRTGTESIWVTGQKHGPSSWSVPNHFCVSLLPLLAWILLQWKSNSNIT